MKMIQLFLLVTCGAALRLHKGEALKNIQKNNVPSTEIFYEGKLLSEPDARAKMKRSTVTFMVPLGPGRNEFVKYIRANVEQVGSLFKSFTVVIGTPAGSGGEEYSKEWKASALAPAACKGVLCVAKEPYEVGIATNENTIPYSCTLIKKPCRAGRGRQAILEHIFANPAKHGADYVISVDSDMGKQWNVQGFVEAMRLEDSNWAMLSANGIATGTGAYQDWLPWIAASNNTYKKGYIFDPKGKAILVKGAYGGLAIYKLEALRGCSHTCDYKTAGKGCELNCIDDCLTKKGENLYMHPALIIEWKAYHSKAPNENENSWVCKDKLCNPPDFSYIKPTAL